MSVWWLVLAIALAGVLTARRWLPDAATVVDTAYDAYRGLVPAARPSVRVVTKRVARACRRSRVVMPFGQKAVLPRTFVVDLHPEEYAVVAPLRATVQEVVGASLVRTATAKSWTCVPDPQVRLRSSDQVAEGRPQVSSSTLPGPEATRRVTGAAPEPAAALAAEPTATLAAEPTATLTEPTATLAVEPTVTLAAEPTAAREPVVALREHRLTSDSGGPAIVVRDRPVTVGRDAACTVRVGYPSASRWHFRLIPTGTGCRIDDLGSRHGTLLNGRRLTAPEALRQGDTVRIGTRGPSWTYGASVGSYAAAPYRARQPGPHGGRQGGLDEAG
ncbi:hypothetical protein BH20ACT5_BH20ACT5_18820 [soil metagenome]